MVRKCKYCDKWFSGRNSKNIAEFCSEYCQKENWRQLNIQRDALNKSVYYLKNKKILEPRICEQCKIEFQPKRKDAKFCSQKCGRAHWRLNNKEYIKEDQRQRYHNDINRKISTCLRSRLNKALEDNVKSDSTMKLIGCTIDELRIYLESQFEPWMSWENHGPYDPNRKTWHFDHIVPMSAYDLRDPEQQREACKFSNIRPFLAERNLKKGNKHE